MSKSLKSCKQGFTLAEVLITLGVIGVVAAMTIPIISTNIAKRQTVIALKKSHSNLAQLVKRIEYEYGGVEAMDGCSGVWYKRDKEKIVKGQIAPLLPGSTVFDEPNDRPFHTYLCDADYHYLNGGVWGAGGNSRIQSVLVGDTTCMGFEVARAYTDKISLGVYVDINGPRKPNVLGRDLFEFYIMQDGHVYPMGYDQPDDIVKKRCNNAMSTDQSGHFCAERIKRAGWVIDSSYPWKMVKR